MARAPRIQIAQGRYHVTAAACGERALFLDYVDKSMFETLLADTIERQEWSCLSYCLMSTHYHLLVIPTRDDLAVGMQRINSLYAQSFNRRHGMSGHVFKARYHSEFIQSDAHLLESCRYVALNPVRAGLCQKPADWPWSSYAETIGSKSPRAFIAVGEILSLFSGDPQLARSRFQAFAEEGLSLSGRGHIRRAS